MAQQNTHRTHHMQYAPAAPTHALQEQHELDTEMSFFSNHLLLATSELMKKVWIDFKNSRLWAVLSLWRGVSMLLHSHSLTTQSQSVQV